ncbi:MAG: IS3 family transposase [Eubacteriales bacterium]|nr:IS3 family transposase [Eubacteriales bacterium]
MGQLTKTLEENGLGIETTGLSYYQQMVHQFKMGGFPMETPKEAAGHPDAPEQHPLILSGKYEWCNNKTGITITPRFQQELSGQYPGIPVEDILKNAGIDPLDAGYLRVRRIKQELQNKVPSPVIPEGAGTEFREEDVRRISSHPYAEGIQGSRIVLKDAFFNDAFLLFPLGLEEIFRVFELETDWFSQKEQAVILSQLQGWTVREYTEPGLSPVFLEISGNRERAMSRMLAEGFERIRGLLPGSDTQRKRQLCQYISEIPRDPWGYYTIRRILEKTGMAKSTYYALLYDETYGRGKERREKQEAQDLELIRKTVEYKGYAKGYRQVYMMLEQVAGKSLSINRVRTLMQRYGLNPGIRRPSRNRKAIRELMERNGRPNLLGREFRLHRPNEVRLTDVTYLDYGDGYRAYGSASIDPVTGRLICFVISGNNDLQLALDTLSAMDSYPAVNGGILHSDQGILYLTDDFQAEATLHGLIQSMSRRGNCLDNSPQESFFGHFKDECPYKNCRDLEELQSTVDAYRVYYNEERHIWDHEQMTPAAYETYLEGMPDEEYTAYMADMEETYRKKKEEAAAKATERARMQRQAVRKALEEWKHEDRGQRQEV